MTWNDPLIFFLAVVNLTLPGVLKSDNWPAWVNSLIATGVILLFSWIEGLVGGRFTENLGENWVILIGIFSALLAGPLNGLDAFLTTAVDLPFHPNVPSSAGALSRLSARSMATSAYDPTRIPRRASRPTTTATTKTPTRPLPPKDGA